MSDRLKHAVAKRYNTKLRCIDQPNSAPRFVYFIRSGEFVKIGISDDPTDRMAELQVGNPVTLALEASVQTLTPWLDEDVLHDRFDSKRVRGEWFRLSTATVMAVVKELNNP